MGMQSQDFDTIEWSYNDENGIGHLMFDRPDAHHALSAQLKADFIDGFEAFMDIDEQNPGVSVRAVIVEGSGDEAFSAGADITEFEGRDQGVFEPADAWDICEEFDAPVIAKIDGYAFGGGFELALACDFRFASERSKLGLPEVNIGIIPGGGGTQRLPDLVGPSRAKELCITGEHISASEAEADGIVNHVYPADELDDEVQSFAESLARQPPLAVRAIKDVIRVSQETDLAEGRRYEARACMSLFATEDQKEGARAFEENREPEWTGQ
jgi:enoyl-CoA hydratase/carnithine racemase